MAPDSTWSVQNILVIDDHPLNLQVAEGHLVGAGYSVRLAETGPKGLAAFQERAPDLVLLDIRMPEMDGFETCQRLKALPGGKDTPVVFLTAMGDLDSHQKALGSGADDFLTKPINRTELLIRVRSLLWVKRLKTELSEGYDLIRSQRDALLSAQRQREELSELLVHDLKNPLSVIVVNIEFVLQSLRADEDVQGALADAQQSARTMHQMVLNLLDISRSESGQLIPKPREFDLAELIDQVLSALRQQAAQRGQTLRFEHPAGAAGIHADIDLVRRTLENLIENSIKYAPAKSEIQVDVQLGAEAVEIRVRDKGMGIPPADRERIFEKYFRLESGDVLQGRSSRGLGLVFCRLAIEAHGGRLWVEENVPMGSVFCARLPAAGSQVQNIVG